MIDMPYDYYEFLKKQHESDEYMETEELVRQNLWNETINFKLANSWIKTEDRILLKLYQNLRYS